MGSVAVNVPLIYLLISVLYRSFASVLKLFTYVSFSCFLFTFVFIFFFENRPTLFSGWIS